MTSYYNEVDKHAAAWLRELVKAGHIADGIVDERDIQDVLPSDLAGFTQCHFFAGIGVWSYALGLAGWPDDQPVWTGSCPCQPFSSAGKGSAFADERHLWPAFHHLIKECRPPVVFGEQVASKDADTWIDLVQTDLEAVGYAVGAVPFPAASVGAPHIRDRMYWVADANYAGSQGRGKVRQRAVECAAGSGGMVGGVADPSSVGCAGGRQHHGSKKQGAGIAPTIGSGLRQQTEERGAVNGFWRDAEWIRCLDDRQRPIEPGSFPLVNGAAARVVRGGSDGLPIDSDKTGEARVMRLRGYGNSINAVAAKAFIESFMDYQQQVSA